MIPILRRYLAPYQWPIVLVIALLLVQAIANLYLPELNADIINNGVAKGDTDYILGTGGFMLVVTFALMVASIIAVFFSARVAMGFGRDVRSAIFRSVETFSQVEVNHFGAASLITRNTNDVQQMQQVVLLALNMMISAPILTIGGVIMALRQDVPLTGILLVIIPIMAVLILIVMSRAIPLFQAMQRKIDRINLVMRDKLTGIRVIRAFVRTEHEEASLRRRVARPHGYRLAGEPPVRDHDAGPDADHEPVDGGGPVAGLLPGQPRARCRSAT